MSVKQSLATLKDATKKGISPTVEAMDDLIEDLDDFLTFVEDYDEWDANKESWRGEIGESFLVNEPAFTVRKLRVALGFDEEGK